MGLTGKQGRTWVGAWVHGWVLGGGVVGCVCVLNVVLYYLDGGLDVVYFYQLLGTVRTQNLVKVLFSEKVENC